jgi:hypothetical protein
MNKPVLFLRTASVLTLIHAVLHTIGGVFGKIDAGAASVAAEAMKTNTFLFMGVTRSFWEFHRGLGLFVTISLTAESILMWQLSSLAKTDARRLRPLMATFLAAYAVIAINSCVYFFAIPVITELLIATCLGAAFVTAKPREAA